tara:strand:- start:311 stop:1150 length:840 start_codon:yes stop_codon:yes gene_type:complete
MILPDTMIVITGDCLSSGTGVLDPEIFKDDFEKALSLPEDQYDHARLKKVYDLYLRHDPKYKKINDKSERVRHLMAYKKITDLEHKVSWPCFLEKKLNKPVLNLSQGGTNFTEMMDVFEESVRNKGVRPTHVIHQIPRHWRVTIKSNAHGQSRRVMLGPEILCHDTILNNIKKHFTEPKGEYYLCAEYKKMLMDEDYFNNKIKAGLKRNEELQDEFGYKTFYMLTQSITKKCMTNETILHADLLNFTRENFKGVGNITDYPADQDYTSYMVELVSSVID